MFKNQDITLEYIELVKELLLRNWCDLLIKFEGFAKKYENDEEIALIKRECEGMKAHILEEMGKYEEALVIKSQHLSEIKDTDPSYPTKLGLVLLLYHKLNRDSEVIKLLEDYLGTSPNIPNDEVIFLLGIYMDILESSNEELPSKYCSYVEKFAVRTDVNDYKVENLNYAIKELRDYRSKAFMKFSQIRDSIEKLDRNEKVKIIKEFIKNELVGLFREIARERLNTI